MELDELKEVWAALDAKLKKNVELEESIILEMMKSKAGKLVNRFITWEIISVIVLLLFLPVCFFWFGLFGGRNMASDILLFYGVALCFTYPIWGILKIHGLMKFDFLKDIGNNISCINRYNIQIKREKKISSIFIWPVMVILILLHVISMRATMPLWMWFFTIFLLVIVTLFNFWWYKKFNKDISSILRSLDEIRELKEE